MRHITDGLSQTLMLSEVRRRDHSLDQRGAWALPWPGSTALAYDVHSASVVTHSGSATYLPDLSLSPNFQAQPPNNPGPNVDVLYDCPDVAMAQLDGVSCGKWEEPGIVGFHWLSAAPRSLHPGGVNALWVDGHITFLPDNVDDATMALAVSINDGQVIDHTKLGQ